MSGPIPNGSAAARGEGLALDAEFRLYLTRQLWRRGLRHHSRRAEGLELALHLCAIELWRAPEPPTDWRNWRALLDRAVYRALRELRPAGAPFAAPDAVPARPDPTTLDEDLPVALDLRALVERLPVGQRLVAKLKLAEVFYPDLPPEAPTWRPDEGEHLLQRHPGQTLETLEAGLLARLTGCEHRHHGKVPATVIAWLLGRASANAVDAAYRALKQQWRREVPGDGHLPTSTRRPTPSGSFGITPTVVGFDRERPGLRRRGRPAIPTASWGATETFVAA